MPPIFEIAVIVYAFEIGNDLNLHKRSDLKKK